MNCRPILLVEDDEDIRTQVAYALESEGYQVFTAENGRKALDLLLRLPASELPGCMILDLMMPEMDGQTLMKTLEADYPGRFSGMKVLVATAKGSPVNPESIPGSVERMQKPFDLEELYSRVEYLCGKPTPP